MNCVSCWGLILLGLVCGISCSVGDREFFYQQCRAQCIATSCQNDDFRAPPSIDLVLLRWSCSDNCSYTCMHSAREKRESKGMPMVQYHGKWPFRRVFGIQEFFSALFSFVNILPHMYFFIVSLGYSLPLHLQLMRFHSFMGVLAFFFSTIFHSRDVPLTEMLDYSGAFIYAVSLLAAMLACVLELFNALKLQRFANVALLVFASCHLYYLFWIKFDYGWNMKVVITMTALVSILSCVYAYKKSFQNGSWKVPFSSLMSLPLGLFFEVFDFPPFLLYLDAHACWHACTPPLFYLFYTYFLDEMKKLKHNKKE